MDNFSWLEQEADLSPAALTVRAQALPANDQDRLVHDVFFPRQNVDSVKLSNFLTTDFRPVADRREWNTRGRLIPTKSFRRQEMEMIPVESYFKIAEKEMQALLERTNGRQDLIRELLGIQIPTRIDSLVFANRRRLELDAMRAWANGNIVAVNPHTGVSTTVSYGFDVARYQTAGTAWSAVSNAYTTFRQWVQDGEDKIGRPSVGAVMRRATYNEIAADAPASAPANLAPTRAEFENRLQQELQHNFSFYILEHQVDKFTDAGIDYAREKVWPTGKVALVPDGIRVGEMDYAPVGRAFEIARINQDAEIDVRGMSVFKEIAGNGREATFECQVNAFPVPDEQLLWVIAAGV